MAKMFYTQPEAAARLGKSPEEVKQMVREGRLREFMDNGPVYRIEDIDKLAVATGAIPASDAADAVDLELAEDTEGGSKEDTVITSAGISVFDDEDLQIEADPMAQTSITQSIEDHISLEGSGSGSGLLDLTREADDTSLGAELWEEMYPQAPSVGGGEVVSSDQHAPIMEQAPAFGAPPVIEVADALAPAFAGMAFVGVLTVALLAVVLAAIARDIWPSFLVTLSQEQNPYFLAGGLAGAAILFWIIGMAVGRSAAGPRI